jgi:hypothetical protein
MIALAPSSHIVPVFGGRAFLLAFAWLFIGLGVRGFIRRFSWIFASGEETI